MKLDTVELKTERLLLRPFRFEDADDIYAYAGYREYGRYLPPRHPRPYTRRSAEEFIARQVLAAWNTRPAFAIVLDSVVVGGIDLTIDATNDVAELAYDLARLHWGKGLIAEAARAVISWAFKEHGLAKIYAAADLRHGRSTRVMEKVGMTREGVLRSHRKGREGRFDQVYYGILRGEWEEQSK